MNGLRTTECCRQAVTKFILGVLTICASSQVTGQTGSFNANGAIIRPDWEHALVASACYCWTRFRSNGQSNKPQLTVWTSSSALMNTYALYEQLRSITMGIINITTSIPQCHLRSKIVGGSRQYSMTRLSCTAGAHAAPLSVSQCVLSLLPIAVAQQGRHVAQLHVVQIHKRHLIRATCLIFWGGGSFLWPAGKCGRRSRILRGLLLLQPQ